MNFLVRLPNWLGDVVMSTAFLNELRGRFPDAAIDVIVKEELQELIACLPPVRNVFLFSKKKYPGLYGLYQFGRGVARAERYDVFFSLPGSFSSALIGYLSRARRRIGFRQGPNAILLTERPGKPANLHRVDEYLSLLKCLPTTATFSGRVRLVPRNKPFQRIAGLPAKYIVLNAISEAQSRSLPLDYAVSLTNHLIAALKVPLVFTGTGKQAGFYDSLIAELKEPASAYNWSGRTSLGDLINLMHFAELIVSTDSGPAHVANALNKKLIVLFGAGNELNSGPYNREGASILRVNLECSPCVSNTCKYGRPKCLLNIKTEDIVASAKNALAAPSS